MFECSNAQVLVAALQAAATAQAAAQAAADGGDGPAQVRHWSKDTRTSLTTGRTQFDHWSVWLTGDGPVLADHWSNPTGPQFDHSQHGVTAGQMGV